MSERDRRVRIPETMRSEAARELDPRPRGAIDWSKVHDHGTDAPPTLIEGIEIEPMPEHNEVLPNFAEHDEDAKNHPMETPIAPPGNFRRYLDRYWRTEAGVPTRCALSTSVTGVVTRSPGCAPRAGTPTESTSRRST